MILRTLGLAALLASSYFAASSEKTSLEGTWALYALEVNGRTVDVKDVRDARLVIKGDQYLFRLGKEQLVLTHKMSPSASPRQIDLKVCSGTLKGMTYRGIYRLEANTYTICRHVDPEKDRPTMFATKPGSGLMLVVWKRLAP
jgi:uncharacterized protein (TIGR03067 family)